MAGIKSHFERTGIRNWIIYGLAVGIPVITALGGSYFLGRQAIQIQNSQNDYARTEEVRSQLRLLNQDIWNGVEGVKTRVQAYWLMRNQIGNRAILDDQILAYARIEPDQTVKELIKNPTWTRQYLANLNGAVQKAAREFSIQNIRQSGASIVKIPKTNGLAGDYLGIAFYPSNAHAVTTATAAATANAGLVMAVVDPEQVFTNFNRWINRRESGNLRGYLISSDGKVLVHSERAYTGSDFSSAQIFQHALISLFKNQRGSGTGTFTGVDLRPVLTSYQRVGSLPFAMVVERVVPPAGSFMYRQILIPGGLLVATVLFLSLLSVLGIGFAVSKRKDGIVRIPEMDPVLARFAEVQNDREEIDQFKHQLQSALTRFGHNPDSNPTAADSANEQIMTQEAASLVQSLLKDSPPETEN